MALISILTGEIRSFSIPRLTLDQAAKRGLIYRNPIDAVVSSKPEKKIPETLAIYQAKRFLDTIKKHKWYPIYVLAIAADMRDGEILALRWEDIDLENNEINMSCTVKYIGGKSIPSPPKTDKARSTI